MDCRRATVWVPRVLISTRVAHRLATVSFVSVNASVVISLEHVWTASPSFYLHRIVFFKRGRRVLWSPTVFHSRKRWAIDPTSRSSLSLRNILVATPISTLFAGLRMTDRFANVPRFSRVNLGRFRLLAQLIQIVLDGTSDVIENIQGSRHSRHVFNHGDALVMLSRLFCNIKMIK